MRDLVRLTWHLEQRFWKVFRSLPRATHVVSSLRMTLGGVLRSSRMTLGRELCGTMSAAMGIAQPKFPAYWKSFAIWR